MKNNYNIIIADRDRRVREFLNREMTLVGYHIWQAKDYNELMNRLKREDSMDLLILDPDLPDVEEGLLFTEIKEKLPLLPIIVHTYRFNKQSIPHSNYPIIFIEKRGNSIDLLIKKVGALLEGQLSG